MHMPVVLRTFALLATKYRILPYDMKFDAQVIQKAYRISNSDCISRILEPKSPVWRFELWRERERFGGLIYRKKGAGGKRRYCSRNPSALISARENELNILQTRKKPIPVFVANHNP